MAKYQIGANFAELVYRAADESEHTQPASDIVTAGSLIDPETGDDMDLAYVVVDLESPGVEEIVPDEEHTWDNALPRAIYEAMLDRDPIDDEEEEKIERALEWLQENESSDLLWSMLNNLFDEIQEIA